ncbi:hypothetical protein EG68_08454 [Paragonimus skrjabini miyazakii]|uniref:Uncharacterized protein n=1 Tax=Paragonimus skrjabini miyazakii TaxID=59628 RepID=A0A8S9YE96_9TREM|nr:hypothetical protein EG68_08454 [Paragonimus skrjabini miyazakii]
MAAVAEALSGLLGGTLEEDQSQELFDLFELTPECRSLTVDEFCVLCALTERLYYQKNLRSLTEETQQMLRGPLEAADFHGVLTRLDGVNVSPALERLLERICQAAEEDSSQIEPPGRCNSQETLITKGDTNLLQRPPADDVSLRFTAQPRT